jgi:hypothetical protein
MIDAILNSPTFLTGLMVRLTLSVISFVLLVKFMRVRSMHRKDFHFSYIAIGITVFFICYLLANVQLELGFALGLFAIFAIIRYRTYQIPIKEMTYLFVVIALAVINALASDPVGLVELIIVNAAVVLGLVLLEKLFEHKTSYSLRVKYSGSENLHASKEADLLEDLKRMTGLDIQRYQVDNVDYMKGTASIIVFFEDDGSKSQLGKEINE